MPKGTILKPEDYQVAHDIFVGKAIIIVDFHSDESEYLLPSYSIDPEKALLKKEAINSLSEEAKQVIDILIKSPSETIEALSSPNGLITKRSIRLGLQKLWNSKFIAKKVVEELTKWANQL